MREKYRNSIASYNKFSQFTTMNVIDGQAGLIICASLIFHSLTIDNILNIIVLLILAGITLTLALSNNGVIDRAAYASNAWANATQNETRMMSEIDEQVGALSTINGGGATGPKVKVGDDYVTITEDNVTDILGKVVTNYKTPDTTETVTIGDNNYTVSTTYRVYYVDFDGDYGEKGAVYLKADCTANYYALQLDGEKATSKIYDLNPMIATNGPSEDNNNMKGVMWLTDTAKWNALKTSTASSAATNKIQDKVKYVVGAPSVEMMMDSYNTYYGLAGTAPVAIASSEIGGERVKLYRKYDTGTYGYMVGPNNTAAWSYYTTEGTVQTDNNIDTMYYPGNGRYYWLASPSAYSGGYIVLSVSSYNGGYVYYDYYSYSDSFCPLVSLSSDVQLEVRN